MSPRAVHALPPLPAPGSLCSAGACSEPGLEVGGNSLAQHHHHEPTDFPEPSHRPLPWLCLVQAQARPPPVGVLHDHPGLLCPLMRPQGEGCQCSCSWRVRRLASPTYLLQLHRLHPAPHTCLPLLHTCRNSAPALSSLEDGSLGFGFSAGGLPSSCPHTAALAPLPPQAYPRRHSHHACNRTAANLLNSRTFATLVPPCTARWPPVPVLPGRGL